jgi:hypothetical protein
MQVKDTDIYYIKRRDETIRIIIHTYKHENVTRKPMYSYIKQKKSFFFTKMENRRTEQVMSEGWYQWEWGGYGEMV